MSAAPNPLLGALDKVTRPPIVTAMAGCVALGSAAMLGLHLLRLDPARPGGIAEMGDFLAFYTGARLIADGQGAHLYDLAAQAELQRAQDPGVWLPYVNPPLLGALLSPFARWGIVATSYVFDTICVAAFTAAAWALSRQLPELTRTPLRAVTALALVLAFQPVLETMLRGQNSVLSLSLLTLCYVAHREGRGPLLGVALGLLSFKPQLGLLLGLVLVLRREWAAVACALAVSAAHYLLGAAIAGFGWPRPMLDAIAAIEPGQPLQTEISLRGFLTYAFGGGAVVQAAGIAGGLVTAGLAVRYMLGARPTDPSFPLRWALLVVCTLLSSPHVQAYDAAILALPALLVVDHRLREVPALPLAERAAPAAGYLTLPLVHSAQALGFQPHFLGVLALFAWTLRAVRQSSSAPSWRSSQALRSTPPA